MDGLKNEQPIPNEDLKSALNPCRRDALVVVRVDRVTILERFVDVVDEVRGLGFDQVSLEVARL
ncbi:MAG: hypothetical protein ACE5MM_00555 [Nitrospiraceae bacterium]